MRKFAIWIKKLIRGFKSRGLPPAGPGVSSPEIENEIDRVVAQNIAKNGSLLKFKKDLNFWQSVFKSLAYAESGFKLNTRYIEPPSLGKDAITGVQNTSEGLLQLSYQDAKYYKCEFDWAVDKNKNASDLSKTIFNLEKNIKCGLTIMNELVRQRGHFIFNNGNYWAVLKPNNKRHKDFLSQFNKYYPGGI